jgi:large subunit ribosomal protein L23
MKQEQLLQLIKAPRITEKSTLIQSEYNQYVMEVDPRATKPQIKEAVEKIFGVKVTRVNTLNVKGKVKVTQKHKRQTQAIKKAYVTLSPGDKIGMFAAE